MRAHRRFWSIVGLAVGFLAAGGTALADQASETVFTRLLKPGSELHLLLGDGATIKVDAESYLDIPFGLTVTPFEDGAALKSADECTYLKPGVFEIDESLSPDVIVASAAEGGGALIELTVEGDQPIVLATLFEFHSIGAKRWTMERPHGDIYIHVTAELGEGAPRRNTRIDWNGTTNVGGVEGEVKSEMTLVDGESEGWEVSRDEELSELAFTVKSGRARIQYVVDSRPGSPQSLAFPDKQRR